MSVSSQMDAKGPDNSYVAHSGEKTSLIDHVVISEDKLDLVKETSILKDYLNYSDHLPIFLNISLEEFFNIKSEFNDKEMGVNWRKVSDDDAWTYRQLVRDITVNNDLDGPTVADIEEYITSLSHSIVYAAEFTTNEALSAIPETLLEERKCKATARCK